MDKFSQINTILQMISLTNIPLTIMDNVQSIQHIMVMIQFHLHHILVQLDFLNHNVHHSILNCIPNDMDFMDQQTFFYYIKFTFAGNIK